MKMLRFLFGILVAFFTTHSVIAFDIAIYGDGRSLMNQAFSWDTNPNDSSYRQIAVNTDDVWQWYKDMGVNFVEVYYPFPSDYSYLNGLPDLGNMMVMNDAFPWLVRKYINSQYRDLLVAGNPDLCGDYLWNGNYGSNVHISLVDVDQNPNTVEYALRMGLGDSPGRMWNPYPTGGFGGFHGWDHPQDRQVRVNAGGTPYMPMHFQLICRADSNNANPLVAQFYWYVAEGNFHEQSGWWQYPVHNIYRSDFHTIGQFDTLEWTVDPKPEAGNIFTWCHLDDLAPTSTTATSHSFGYAIPVNMKIEWPGNNAFYLYEMKAWSQGYDDLYMTNDSAPTDTITIAQAQSAMVNAFRTQMNLAPSKKNGWYFDEVNGDEVDRSFVKTCGLLQSNGLPQIIMNGQGNDDSLGIRNKLYVQLDSQNVHMPVQMHEFYPLGGQRACASQPLVNLYTTASSDSPYISLTGTCTGGNYDGRKSLQCALDLNLFDPNSFYTQLDANFPYYQPSTECTNPALHVYPGVGLPDQTKWVHDRGTKMWALISGGGGDNCDERMPSPEEVKLQAWLAVASDCDGVMWYPWECGGLIDVAEASNPSNIFGDTCKSGLASENPWYVPTSDTTAIQAPAHSRRFQRSDRYYAAQRVCSDIKRIAPVLEPLRFVKTYASRAYEHNYPNDDSVHYPWIYWDALRNSQAGTSAVEYIRTYAPVTCDSTPASSICWNPTAEQHSYVQASRFQTPGETGEDYWFLIVNRRALDSEQRLVKLGISNVAYPDSGYAYMVEKVLAGTAEVAGMDSSIHGRVVSLILQPGEAELVHFSLADTTTWVITQPETLLAPKFLMRNIEIRNGGGLTIMPNIAALRHRIQGPDSVQYDSVATVTFWQDKGITMRSHGANDQPALKILGSDSIRIRLQSANPDHKWTGVSVSYNVQDHIEFKYTDFCNAVIGVRFDRSGNDWGAWDTAYKSVDHCTFSNCGFGLSIWGGRAADVTHSVFVDNNYGISCNGSLVRLTGSRVANSQEMGIILLRMSTGTFTGDTITGNCLDKPATPSPYLYNAIWCWQSSALFKCCMVTDNHGRGISSLMSSTVIMADPGDSSPDWGGNQVTGNNTNYPQITSDATNIVLRDGSNSIHGSNGPWIVSPRSDALLYTRNWRNNFWKPTPPEGVAQHLPSDVTIDPPLSTWALCNLAVPDTGNEDEESLLAHAYDELEANKFDQARTGFRSTISSGSRTQRAPSALQATLTTDLRGGHPDTSVAYFKSVADTAQFWQTKKTARSAQIWALAYRGKLDSAMNIVSSILDTAQSDTDRISAQVDLILIHLMQQNLDTANSVTTEHASAALDSIISLLASLSKWTQYDITDSVEMYAPCTVDSSITVETGAVLVIKPYPGIKNPVVNFRSGAGILVQGWPDYFPGPPAAKLYVLGDPDNRVILNWDTANTWTNIESRCGYMELKHAELRGTGWAVFDNNPLGNGTWPHVPVFKADSCIFRSFGDGITCDVTDSSSYIRNCLFTDLGGGVAQWNSYTAALSVMDYGQLDVENCQIEHGGEVGVAVCYGSGINMHNTTVNGSKSYGMVVSDGSVASLECCELSCNGDTLAEAWVDASTVNLIGAHSQFSDSSGTLLYSADPSFVDLGDGENSFNLLTGAGRYLKSGDTTDTWDIGLNTWAPYTPTDTAFYSHLWPRNSARWLVDTSLATFVGCDQGGIMSLGGGSNFVIPGDGDEAGTDSHHPQNDIGETATSISIAQPPTASKFSQAVIKAPTAVGPVAKTLSPLAKKTVNRAEMLRLHHQELVQWRESKALCKSGDKQAATRSTMTFLRDHPGSKLAPAAMVDLSRLARKGDADQTVSKFLSVQATSLIDPEQRKLAQRLSLVAKAREGNPVEALAGLEEIMETAPTPRDSIRALMDAMGVYFFNRHDRSVQPRNVQVKTANHRELVHRVIQLTRMLDNPALAARGTHVVVPTRYALYQNYPNPFNPNTEIRFDLPEAVRVELKIFNILGQEVAKLVDEVRPAGAYRLKWDSKTTSGMSVASGVYIYQLKAGKFTDSKKMMLIR